MGNIQIGPVGSYINITDNLEYKYSFSENIDRQDVRTKQGNLYTYIQSSNFRKFKLPMSWVNSSQRSLINSWWKTGMTLRFFEDSDQPTVYFEVRIVDKTEAFTSFMKPYFKIYYDGELFLETV